MDFKLYINQAWAKHAEDAAAVATDFAKSFRLISESGQTSQMAQLITHVQGEHLGKFQDGLVLLEALKQIPMNNSESLLALDQFAAILKYSENPSFDLSGYSASERVRILATSASAFLGQKDIDGAATAFRLALATATELEESDPALRALAVGSNNLACSLEEKSELTATETTLMHSAAHAGRKYWELAGTWLEVERAEYRLSQSYLRSKDIISSVKHANLCLSICEKNMASPLELFFAYEAIALVEKAMKQPARSLPQMQKYFELLPENEKSWCLPSFEKLKS